MQSTNWVHEALWVPKVIDLGPNLSDSIYLTSCSSIITRPIEAKFHVEPPWNGGTKAASNGPGHMTQVATVHICGKSLLMGDLETSVCTIEYYQICSNDAPGLTLTCFMARSNLVPYAFVWEKVKTINILETIVVCDIKVVRCSQLKWVDEALWVPKVMVVHWPWSKSLWFNIFKLLFLNNRSC